MAHPNEDVVRGYLGAVAAGDLETATGHLADDVTFHIAGRGPMSGDRHGREEVLALLQAAAQAAGGRLAVEIHDLLATDDHAVALVRRTIAGADLPAAIVYHIAGGKIAEAWVHEFNLYAMDEAIGG